MSSNLPHYDTLMRWTVQDVINWLTSVRLGSFVKAFRFAGVDGQKLCKLTNTELVKMKDCPLKTDELLNYIGKIEGVRNNTQGNVLRDIKPSNRNPAPLPEDSDSDTEFSSDEFSDPEEPIQPRAKQRLPPVPSRPAPTPPPQDTPDYMEPDPIQPPAPSKKSLPPVPGSRMEKPNKATLNITRPPPPSKSPVLTKKRPPEPGGQKPLPPTPNEAKTKTPVLPKRQPPDPMRKDPKVDRKVTNQEDLSSFTWYHGNMQREKAKSLLESYNEDGMFLLRDSSHSADQPYTLVVYYGNNVSNLPIRKNAENRYTAGKEKESTFKTMKEMIEFFKKHKLVLASQQEVYLSRPLPK